MQGLTPTMMVSPNTFPSLDKAFLAWSFDWYCRCIQLPGDAICHKVMTHKLLLQLDLPFNAIPSYFLTVCLSMFPYWANWRRMYEAEAGGKLHKHTFMLLSNTAVLMSQFKTILTQTQWPRTGPADHQMTATLPDYRRDPPELETGMPGAHLEIKADNMFSVFPRFWF